MSPYDEPPAGSKWEWAVSWRRRDWRASTMPGRRKFDRRERAEALIRRLYSDDFPDLSPLEWVRIERRPVGDWERVKVWGEQ
jgi:hypothetical protein